MPIIDRASIQACQVTFSQSYSHFIRQTPLWKLPGKALGVDCAEVWLKLEHLQTGGSFKARGMLMTDSQNMPHVGVPIRFQNEPAQPNLEVPELGQDNFRYGVP